MSAEALLLATRDHLRSELGLDATTCEVTADGRPFPFSGMVFYAVHLSSWRNDWCEGAFDEVFGVAVTITKRTARVPQSKVGRAVLVKEQSGLLKLAAAVRLKVHLNYTLMGLANDAIGDGVDANGFREPLLFRSVSVPQAQNANWFAARGESSQKTSDAGMSVTVQFDGARRLQKYEEAT